MEQSAWGQGLMHEALACSIAWGFEHMVLHRIEAQVHPQNTASIKRLQALGFVHEGLLRETGYWLGAHRDLLQFSLLRREFAASP